MTFGNTFGKDHFYTRGTINKLGTICHARGKYDDAISRFNRPRATIALREIRWQTMRPKKSPKIAVQGH
jgi:hypothetical protein